MALTPGTRIGPYEVTGPLGEGGMGVVCRARDTKLQRDVALKLLPDHLAADPDRHARLEREAQVLASLNHPHIAQVHGLEQSDGVTCIVMELVEGPTLADRISTASRGMSIDDVAPLTLQIVSALEAAHSRGVVHRDLKPANIKVTPDGQVKVLDFGLAVAEPAAAGMSGTTINVTNSPTVMATSLPGMVMGTLAYMSPEQARGTTVDSRTDVWAFGCVLYEMLAGRQVFHGETPTDVVAKIVTAAPDWNQLPSQTPSAMKQLLRAALDKDPKKRLQHIGDARLFLEREALTDPTQVSAPADRRRRLMWPLVAAASALLAAVVTWLSLKPAPEPRLLAYLTLPLPDTAEIPRAGEPGTFAVSRDGSRIVFRADGRLFLRNLSDPDATPIPGTEGGFGPVFSPTGDEVAFLAPPDLKKVSVLGGAPVTVAQGINGVASPKWGDDGNIFVGTAASILRIPASGGKPEIVARADIAAGERYVFAEPLPGGSYVLVGGTTIRDQTRESAVIAIDVRTGKKRPVLRNVGNFSFVPSGTRPGIGHLVYLSERRMFAAPFDSDTLQAGSAVPVLDGVVTGVSGYAFSDSGLLAYYPLSGDGRAMATLAWADRTGLEEPLSIPPDAYVAPRLSPDATRVAVSVRNSPNPFSTESDLFVQELARPARVKVTFGGSNTAPLWISGGSHLIYRHADLDRGTGLISVAGTGLISVAADGGSPPMPLWQGAFIPYSVSRGGVLIASTPPEFNNPNSSPGTRPGGDGRAPGAGADNVRLGRRGGTSFPGRGRARSNNQLWTLRLGPDGKPAGDPQPFLDARFLHQNAEFSPDGKWIAFQSNQNRTNQFEVYVVPFPAGTPAIPISNGGGEQPRWNSNGRELFYRGGNQMMAVDVSTAGATFSAGTSHVLFEKVMDGYDVAPNGARFLILKPVSRGTQPNALNVILNWFEELRRRAPLPE